MRKLPPQTLRNLSLVYIGAAATQKPFCLLNLHDLLIICLCEKLKFVFGWR